MSEGVDLDLNKVAVGLASHFLESAAERAGSLVGALSAKIRTQFRQGFSDYANSILSKTSKVKTILNIDEAVELSSIYTPLKFRSGPKFFSDEEVQKSFLSEGKCIIVGTAGGGKTIFLKNLYNKMAANPHGIFPLFYELRLINLKDAGGLLDSVFGDFREHVPTISRADFDARVKDGRFPLILDGFDEINFDKRQEYIFEISELIENNENVKVIITTRPGEELEQLIQFRNFHVQSMNKAQALVLLEKIDYDKDTKTSFIKAVKDRLYDRHKDFLSNPLLASMMLLTYGSFSDVPDKIYIFYQQAFEVLFQRHDRSKGAFTRKSKCGLATDEFQRIFSYVCALSYANERLSFSDSDVLQLIRSSIEYYDIECDAQNFLDDIVKSVCLMHRDGTFFTFVHRSFQEYFTALFISRLPDVEIKSAVDAELVRSTSDAVISMFHSMEPEKFERTWALSSCKELSNAIDSSKLENFPRIEALKFFQTWGISSGVSTFILDSSLVEGYRCRTLQLRFTEFFKLHERSVKSRYIIWRNLQEYIANHREEHVAVQPLMGRKISVDTFLKRKNFPPFSYSDLRITSDSLFELVGLGEVMRDMALGLENLAHVLQIRIDQRSETSKGIFSSRGFNPRPSSTPR